MQNIEKILSNSNESNINQIPFFAVVNEKTKEVFEQGFSLEAMEYYASQRGEDFAVYCTMVNECDLEVIE